ncbi:hypothetical protein D7Z54_24175 [Salibacterium salarium]|uniref:Uncharacterized protein n=1 Tax=Salibacterium salarium TaxID=284579 RepID=A0A428MX63_9BACI|nr:hypothetical protein [Salibacterium salarium]RSL30737.1 hypothetical protein D7Z54_24175 [Salibacterium salarium]
MEEEKKEYYFYFVLGYIGILLIVLAMLRVSITLGDDLGGFLAISGIALLINYVNYLETQTGTDKKARSYARAISAVIIAGYGIFVAFF